MKIYIKKKISLVILLLITSGVSAEYRQGVDYQLINNPIPIKRNLK